jgi:hypothetical protein
MSAGNGAASAVPDPRPTTSYPTFDVEILTGTAMPPGKRALRFMTPVGCHVFMMDVETAISLGKLLAAPGIVAADPSRVGTARRRAVAREGRWAANRNQG